MLLGKKRSGSVCSKTGCSLKETQKRCWPTWMFSLSSALALFWFLIRVIPKPSRALYPCQRAAFPLASGFVIWLMGGFGSVAAIHKARCSLKKSRYVQWLLLVAVSVGSVWLAVSITTKPNLFADAPAPNSPIGAPKGIHPGRVVWVHDPEATDWDGPGDGHWWESSHTNQSVVSQMMSRAVQSLTGNPNDKAAWESLFKHFNTMHGKGDVGYQPKEKIFIKVNFVGCIQIHSRRPVTETSDYDLKSQDYMNTSPQMIIAILEQLVDRVGVKQSDITVGDPLCYFANEYYQMCKARFPEVQYLDYLGKFGRTAVKQSSVALFWSTPDAAGKKIDHIPESYVQAEYLINLANLKSHNDLAGVTLCAKNHYGSLARKPAGQDDYYDMHKNLPRILPGMGHYRPLVDLMGHKHLGGKTLLYLIDGLYAGKHAKDRAPKKWNSIPFEGDWTSSLLASQDPVAIDSVGFDFLYMEWNDAPHWSGANDYLIEAAMADNPPSGTFYDPDHDGNVVRLRSLGVYEHWNNPIDKQYSRNLGSNKGIELLKLADDITGSQVSVVNRK